MTIYKEYGIREHWKHWSAWLLSPNKKKAKLGQIFFWVSVGTLIIVIIQAYQTDRQAARQTVWRGRKRMTRGTKMTHTRARTSRWRVTNPGLNICRSAETRRFFSYSSSHYFFLGQPSNINIFCYVVSVCVCVEFAAWATTRTQWLLCGIKPHPYEIKNANQERKYDEPKTREKETLNDAASCKENCNCCKSVRQSACLVFSPSLYACSCVCVCLRLPKTWQLHAAAPAPEEEPHLGGRATKIFKSLLHWFSLAFSFCRNENGSFGFCFFFFTSAEFGFLCFFFVYFYSAACMIWHNFDELFWAGLGSCCQDRWQALITVFRYGCTR